MGGHCGQTGHGLIPAGAGQTICRTSCRMVVRAHPRRCGADPFFRMAWTVDDGSSPQVRGRLNKRRRWNLDTGLIPAGAGQT